VCAGAGVSVHDEVQRDAGESVELLKSLSSDVVVHIFKAASSAFRAPQPNNEP
jgi:hypothetical protein